MPKKYVKKPIEIEALEWTGENTTEILAFCSDCYSYVRDDKPVLAINTLEGNMTASLGDYVIKGLIGEFYACKPEVFVKTYEEVTI